MAAKSKEIFNDLNLVLRLNQHIEELTATEASAAALLAKESSFKVLAELSSIETPDPRADAQFEHQRAEFRGAGVASSLPFHLQGDMAFNEASALARRRQLRHSDAIKAKIQFLWQVARGRNAVVELTHAQRRPSGPTRAPATGSINEREYAEMMLLIFKVLRDDFVLETAQLQIQCDWEVDSHHGDALSYDQFFPALFELVDVWTCDILEATYVRFLELLTRRITVRVVVFLDDMKLKLALSDNFDEAVVVKAIPLSTIKQFASVAKVLEGTSVRTVGDLAAADPREVEKQRASYLDRNAFSKDKIGADLEHLLRMFREISEQFQDANYSLNNMVLQRLPHDKGDGERSRSVGANGAYQSQPSAPSGARNGSNSTTRGGLQQSDPMYPDASTASRTDAGYTSTSVHYGGGNGGSVSSDRAGGYQARSMRSGSAAEAEAILKRGGIKRINTFRDITVTETGVLDALKTTFLIEKGISIQRKTSMESIKAELVKFGVDPKTMDDAEIQEKYERLYEMFVLRDGDNIKGLAESILARIKMELAAHGVEVNEEEMEAIYDGFYGSVVSGSGDRIVADAKNWVDDTVGSKSYSTYIKQEYHELKSIDEVKLLGSCVEDEEFVSLLSKEDSDDEHGESADTIGKGADSPTMKGVAPLSRRPSLYRGLSDSPKKDKDQSERGLAARSTRSLDALGSNNATNAASTDQSSVAAMEQEVVKDEVSTQIASREAEPEQDEHDYSADTMSDEARGDWSDTLAGEVQALAVARDKDDDRSAEQSDPTALDAPVITQDVPGEHIEVPATDAVLDNNDTTRSTQAISEDDSKRRSSVVNLKPATKNPSDLEDDGSANLDGNHGKLNELDREPQGVGYEYDEGEEPIPVEAPVAAPERPVVREPKVPDIVIGGTETGKSIAVTARYIQLLGLGNVTTLTSEADLMATLETPAKDDIDLVLFDVGEELDSAVTKAKELVGVLGRRVMFLGGDESQPEKSAVIARLCVSEGGLLYFATTPIDFPALRAEIQVYFDASPQPYLLRPRRATGMFGAAAKLVTSSIRASNMICVDEEHPRSVLTPPLSVDSSSAKRKASEVSTPVLTPLPQLVAPKRDTFSPFRPLRVIDEMPGADITYMKRLNPVVPPSHAPKAKGKSPRISAAMKKLMR